MKKFIITEEERKRILNMHKSRTSNQYLMEQSEELPAYNSEYFTNNPTGTMTFEPNKGLVKVNGKDYQNLAYIDTGKSFNDFFMPTLGRASGNILGNFNYVVEDDGSIKLTPTDDNQDTFCTENDCRFNPKNIN